MIRTRCLLQVAILTLITISLFTKNLTYGFNSTKYDFGSPDRIYNNQFAVHIPGGAEEAEEIAAKYGFRNIGQIGDLDNYFLLEHHHIHKRSLDSSPHHHKTLESDPKVKWVEQQVELKRVKRDGQGFGDFPFWSNGFSTLSSNVPGGAHSRRQFMGRLSRFSFLSTNPSPHPVRFPDPFFTQQWYLMKGADGGHDMNVEPAWERGYTGRGVVVSILDDGIQHNHPDIAKNYDAEASTDINENDSDPMPQDNGENRHGTRCAGEAAAVAFNDFCGVGVAYNAKIGGVRMLDGTVNDAVEARAISLNPNHIDIYSASWGPEDDGKTVDGPGPLAKRAFINGVIRGRFGKGSIFVWASGNGGRHTDNCNCDGYTNSIFTLSISSASQRGFKPWYLEECSSTLATTYSSGTPGVDNGVTTVDQDGKLRRDRMCTIDHTGTSASAPLAAGICALALEANSGLTWRDMQHLVVRTSRKDPLRKENGWFTNGVGRNVSHKFGYGLMDAAAMVSLAEVWTTVPLQHVCQTIVDRTEKTIPAVSQASIHAEITTDGCAGTNGEVRYLEHVQARVTLRFLPRGNINIRLISPSGTSSTLLFERPRDTLSEKFDDWPFLTVHFWGEKAAGTWQLIVTNSGTKQAHHPGVLVQWQLILHGTKTDPEPSNLRDTTQSFGVFRPTRVSLNNFDGQIGSGSSPKEVVTSLDQESTKVNTTKTKNPPIAENDIIESDVCHSECLGGCSGPGPDHCISCQHFSLMSECVSTCPEGTYASEDNRCLNCHESCALCSGPLMNQCMACQANRLFISHLGVCGFTCPVGFYAVNGSCISCGRHCTECSGDSNTCSRCEHNLLLFNNTCISACPDGFYETDNNICKECSKGCKTCYNRGPYDCASCHDDNSFLYNGKCFAKCPYGYYGDSATGQCLLCPHGCSSCNKNNCLSCSTGWRLKNGNCVSKNNFCQLHQYREGKECLDCHKFCVSCLGPKDNECLLCNQPHILHEMKCVQECPEKHFNLNGRCVPCLHGCRSCSSYENCTSCITPYHLQHHRCLTHCADGYFSDLGICSLCDPSCLSCWGPNKDQCATCSKNSFLLNSKCYRTCPDGFFAKDRECLPCHHNCQTCNGSSLNACLSCAEFYTLDGGMCLECRSGRYYNSSSQSCESCHSSCLTCTGDDPFSCISCQAPLSLHPSTRSCRKCCPKGVKEKDDGADCCDCDSSTGQCFGSVTTDKRRIASDMEVLSRKSTSSSFIFPSVTSVVVVICFVNIIIFITVFTVLQVRSSGQCMRKKYSYKRLPISMSTKTERVSLTLTPFTEEDSDYNDDENEILYART